MSWYEKYICLDCGTTFDEFDAGEYRETYGEGVMRGSVSYICCPSCGSDNYDDAVECSYCGELVAKEEVETDIDGEYVCPECKKELIEKGEWEE